MTPRHSMLSLALAAGLASPAIATDRYWVSPLIGNWNDAGNWSLLSGGGAFGGVPLPNDDIFFDQRSICIINETGPMFPFFGDVVLSGSGSGVTSVQHPAGVNMNPSSLVVGMDSDSCEYIHGGSMITGTVVVAEGAGAEGEFDVINSGEVVASSVIVGKDLGQGELLIDGSLFEFTSLSTSFETFLPPAAGPGYGMIEIGSGIILGDSVTVGLDGRGDLFQSGGDIDVDSYRVALFDSLPASTSIHTGGTLDVLGFLEIGIGFAGNAVFTIDGADVGCGTIYAGEGPDANATLNLSSGSLDTNAARIGIEGEATLNQVGGAFTAGSVSIGELGNDLREGSWNCFGGTSVVSGNVRVGAGNTGHGNLNVDGGSLTCDRLILADAVNSYGFSEIDEGSIDADVLHVGALDVGFFNQRGGDVDVGELLVDDANSDSLYQITGPEFGTLRADTISNLAEIRIFGGLVVAGAIENASNAEIRLGNSPDIRTPSVVNDGMFTFGTGSVILSGPLLGPPFNARLLGSFQNNGTLVSSTGLAGDFAMNITNDGVVDIIGSADLDANGSILNRGVINVDSDGGALTAVLQCDNAGGIVNRGTINISDATIRTTNGPFNNDGGEIQGPGLIEGGLHNDGLIGRGLALEELRIQGGLTSGAGAALEFQRYPGLNNSIRVTTGDAQLAGAISVDFDFFTPVPGAQYVLLSVDSGSIIGTFDSVSITDAGGNAEIVYEPTRVLVRVLDACSGADLANPLGVLDFNDVIAFLTAFSAGDPVADLAPPGGVYDFNDVIAYLSLFATGCP